VSLLVLPVNARDISTLLNEGSLVLTDIGHNDWRRIFSNADDVPVRRDAYIDPTYGSLGYVNEYSQALGSGALAQEVVVPPGATSMTFSIVTKQGATVGSIVMGLFTGSTAAPLTFAGLAAPLASLVVTPNAAVTLSSVTANALTPGDVIFAAVTSNNTALGGTAGQRHYIGRPLVRSNSSDSFWGSLLQRLHVGDENIIDNAWDLKPWSYLTPVTRGYECSPGSRVRVLTDATELGLEVFNTCDTSNDVIKRSSAIVVFVDGRYFGEFQPTVQKRELTKIVGLPVGLKTIEFTMTMNTGGSTGSWLQAVYAPSNAVLDAVTDRTPKRKLLMYGDSIAVGTFPVGNAKGNPVLILRNRFAGAVLMDGYGGRRLSLDAASGVSGAMVYNLANATAFAQSIARNNPDEIIWQVGTNDYAFGDWASAAAYETALGNTLDLIHALLPSARIWIFKPLTRTGETTPINGITLPNIRTAQDNVVAARSWIAGVIPGQNFGNLTSDGIHPDESQTYRIWNAAFSYIGGFNW